MDNSVEVTGTQQVVVTEVATNVVEVVAPAAPAVVEVSTAGPQGASGVTTLNALEDVNTTQRVGGSVLYYDAASGLWKGDDINTIVTITDGGHW